MSQSIEEYIEKASKDFTMHFFQTFYLDVIHRKYHLQQFLDEDDLFKEEVAKLANYDFIELRKLYNIDKNMGIMDGEERIAQLLHEPLRKQVEDSFLWTLVSKYNTITDEWNQTPESDRQKDVLAKHRANIERAIQQHQQSRKEGDIVS